MDTNKSLNVGDVVSVNGADLPVVASGVAGVAGLKMMEGELGDVIDRVNQKLQVLMSMVEGNDRGETIVQEIAEMLRAHYRAEAVVSDPGARFIAKKRFVMAGARCVAVAPSHTMAKRIARALNGHVINERGV